MSLRFFSDSKRPPHLGPYPSERLSRRDGVPDLSGSPTFEPLAFDKPDDPLSIINAMTEHQAMLDAIRRGLINRAMSACPSDRVERSNHLKAFGYFNDASVVGICAVLDDALLDTPFVNPHIDRLANQLRTRQTQSLASGIDMIMADLRESMDAPPASIAAHSHALVLMYEYPRDPGVDEPGTQWIQGAQQHRACLLAAETAVVLANYIRLLGFDATAHTASSSDVDLHKLAVLAGLAIIEQGSLVNPYIGRRFGLAAVTTTFELATDKPLAPVAEQHRGRTHGIAWTLGKGFAKNAFNHIPFATRRFMDGQYPFETLKRVDTPTTYIDEAHVARVPKRSDLFARAQFGDMGKPLQEGAKGGLYVRKAAPSSAQRRALGAFVLLQDGEPENKRTTLDPRQAAELIKATGYFLGADAMGLSRCPPWAWYSHDASGAVLDPPHDQAISMIIDQGYSTMDGSSGDDWIAVSQSMRAYLRFSLLGGVLAKQIRNLGYSAKAHTVMDGEVLQPPLLLLAGLGEVSRIGEVILNPFLGPRLKSGAVTTDLPLVHDKPIDFGLQQFCESCRKCARECPSGAITAGPKLMFNGYEIWKSDSQKCATYRITTQGGAMCGRCMKTCPWNLEGVIAEKPFRWLAMNMPAAAPMLASLDDSLNRGSLNAAKKWWWDLEVHADGSYRPTTKPVNQRTLQKKLKLSYEQQTLAVYPANLAPHPYPYPYPMDREKGIEAYQALITAEQYQLRLARGETSGLFHQYSADVDSPVIQVVLAQVDAMTDSVSRYRFRSVDGQPLPEWQAGAHLDIVIAPEYLRQYSMSGDPADRSSYEIGVLREDAGRGGSQLLHRIFIPGRKLFISRPINHFPLQEGATMSYLMAGGIGITPLIAMAHRLHAIGAEFELHYSGRSKQHMGYLKELASFDWCHRVHYHCSDDGTRVDLDAVLAPFQPGCHLYTCGSSSYMQAVMEAAEQAGYPEQCRHLEYFSVPDAPEWVNREFRLRLAGSGKEITVPSDQSAAQALVHAGYAVNLKCSDGICGVCQCALVDGEVEHRDYVLSARQRRNTIILCQSRAKQANGVITIDIDTLQ